MASISIEDNDASITVSIPTSAWDGQTSPVTGTVRIGGTLTSNLVVNLLSSDAFEITVPATVTVLAGQTSATFTLAYPSDGIKDGSQSVLVTGSAAGLASGVASVVVHDSDLDRLAFDPIAGTKTAGTSFATTFRAFNIDNETMGVFGGAGSRAEMGPSGSTPVTPTSFTFAAGVWAGNSTRTTANPSVTLTATSGGGAATSNAFAVQPAAVSRFEWGPVDSPQIASVPLSQP